MPRDTRTWVSSIHLSSMLSSSWGYHLYVYTHHVACNSTYTILQIQLQQVPNSQSSTIPSPTNPLLPPSTPVSILPELMRYVTEANSTGESIAASCGAPMEWSPTEPLQKEVRKCRIRYKRPLRPPSSVSYLSDPEPSSNIPISHRQRKLAFWTK